MPSIEKTKSVRATLIATLQVTRDPAKRCVLLTEIFACDQAIEGGC